MQPHQQRVVDEKQDLDEKRLRLSMFTCTETYSNLEQGERLRLSLQLYFMEKYSEILEQRIAEFSK